jgi:hypothetical protein
MELDIQQMMLQAKDKEQKIIEEAERKAELSKGFQYVDEGNARALPIVYGRNKIGGTRVYTFVTDGVADPNTGPEWFDVFECKKHMYASSKIARVLRNTNQDWSGILRTPNMTLAADSCTLYIAITLDGTVAGNSVTVKLGRAAIRKVVAS